MKTPWFNFAKDQPCRVGSYETRIAGGPVVMRAWTGTEWKPTFPIDAVPNWRGLLSPQRGVKKRSEEKASGDQDVSRTKSERGISEDVAAFINEERRRFEMRDNNMFAVSMSQVARYREFLGVILERFQRASTAWMANTLAMRDAVSPESLPALLNESVNLTRNLHLEIESFYLFAKILLDKMAIGIEYYFGTERRLPLDSHDDLAKRIGAYSTAKGLVLPPDVIEGVTVWKRRVSDFRDYQIAHEKSPRTLRGTTFNFKGSPRLMLARLFPREREQQIESEAIDELAGELDKYVRCLLEFLRINRERTALALAQNKEAEDAMSLSAGEIQQRRSPADLLAFVESIRERAKTDAALRRAGHLRTGYLKEFFDEIVPLAKFAAKAYPDDYVVCPVLGNQGFDAEVFDAQGQFVERVEIANPVDGRRVAKTGRELASSGIGSVRVGEPGDDFDGDVPFGVERGRMTAPHS